ncbi:MAG: ABC transporter permease [Clostridia bacterium]|nr:ABC transporter permease [Clostridia bacterium]
MRLPSPEVLLVAKKDIRSILRQNAVTVMFVVLCTLCMIFSGQTVPYVIYELFGRLSRNSFIVLALIIPIVAGMGINFAITIGAMAAQISVLWVIEWGVGGLPGFLLAMAMTLPIASVFGFLIGKLLNKMKGQEMIGGLILGYFANGLYQLLFLFIFGNLIPLKTSGLVIKGSTGVANTIDLTGGAGGGIKYALDGIWKTDFGTALYVVCGAIALIAIVSIVLKKVSAKKGAIAVGAAAVLCALYQIPAVAALFSMVKVPMVTFGVVGLLCLFNIAIMKTRLGQQFRAVGQNRTVANASGINVDRVRLIAIVISTVLAGWGQLMFVQNMGSFQTYGAHEQVGLYAGAAILVGGASIRKATNGQAILGCILFHLLFIVAPPAAKNLFGDAAIGEYFRVFISYGVIAAALVMHAWSGIQKKKPENALREASAKN